MITSYIIATCAFTGRPAIFRLYGISMFLPDTIKVGEKDVPVTKIVFDKGPDVFVTEPMHQLSAQIPVEATNGTL